MSMLGLLVRLAGSTPLVQERATLVPMSRFPIPADEVFDVARASEMPDLPTCVQVDTIFRSNKVRRADTTLENPK